MKKLTLFTTLFLLAACASKPQKQGAVETIMDSSGHVAAEVTHVQGVIIDLKCFKSEDGCLEDMWGHWWNKMARTVQLANQEIAKLKIPPKVEVKNGKK